MAQKFIISEDGILKFGNVRLVLRILTDSLWLATGLWQVHRDLFTWGEDDCYGGGFWEIDHSRGAIILHGRSFDFGGPDFTRIKRIKWDGVGGKPCALFYAPYYPNLDSLEPVFANP